MTIEDKNHFIAEEKKPDWRETKGFKYQIFKDHVRIISNDGQEIPIPLYSLDNIVANSKEYQKSGYYTGQCLDCHKFDALVKGYCQPCFKKNDMTYDDGSKAN